MRSSCHPVEALKLVKVPVKQPEDGDITSKESSMIKLTLSWPRVTSGDDQLLAQELVMIL